LPKQAFNLCVDQLVFKLNTDVFWEKTSLWWTANWRENSFLQLAVHQEPRIGRGSVLSDGFGQVTRAASPKSPRPEQFGGKKK